MLFDILCYLFFTSTMAASTFLFHPLMSEVVPYNASYEFPSQATRSTKRTIKMTPKNNAQSYLSGSTIRFEFPASGYLNPTKTYLSFNARSKITSGTFVAGTQQLYYGVATTNVAALTNALLQQAQGGFQFQQNIASIFRRVRVTYGSLVLEDIQDYNILQRMFTDTLLSSGTALCDNLMHQGIGASNRLFGNPYSIHDRFNYHTTESDLSTLDSVGTTVRRYAIPINTGVFQQRRLLPLKFMSSQLSIEFELADAVDCQQWAIGTGGSPSIPTACQTEVGLVELNAELLEFDSEFDRAVFTGLSRGLAIPFQSWHMTSQNIQPATLTTINIQESSRSVRYAIAGLTDDNFRTLAKDAHAFLPGLASTQNDLTVSVFAPTTAPFNSVLDVTTSNQTLLANYQWRLGGVYYPSQPVPAYGGTSAVLAAGAIDSNYADPPVECYAELMKIYDNQFAKNQYLGDISFGYYGDKRNGNAGVNPVYASNFLIGVDFLTDRGDIIGGINAEEQNDMQLTLRFNTATAGSAKVVRIAVCFDNIMILGESNNMVLVN